MISDLIKSNTKLYKFMIARGISKRAVKFDEEIWANALEKLSDLNKPEYYFDFEDRLIEEVVLSVLRYRPDEARSEMVRIKKIVDMDLEHTSHLKPYIRSIRNSVSGAVAVALRCLP